MVLMGKCRRKLLQEVFHAVKKANEFKVLVVDQLARKIISGCCRMNDIIYENVALVEVLEKKRQPLDTLEAIYIMEPVPESLNTLLSDFGEFKHTYHRAHVFLLTPCSDELFNKVKESSCVRYIQTFKEINIGFVPVQSQVYSLEDPRISSALYLSHEDSLPVAEIAKKLATLCEVLDAYPYIRYRFKCEKTARIAEILLKELDSFRNGNENFGKNPVKNRSQLLILDRGIDGISPLLHELSFQSMLYDSFTIRNGVYQFQGGGNKAMLLSEKDDFWIELRHQHIAEVARIVTEKQKKFTEENKSNSMGKALGAKNLQQMMKKMPRIQATQKKFNNYTRLAADCMECYNSKLNKICSLEQDIIMGTNKEVHKNKKSWESIAPVLTDEKLSTSDKLRLLLISILSAEGVTTKKLNDGLSRAKISSADAMVFDNIENLGFCVRNQGSTNNTNKSEVPRKDRSSHFKYATSRWTPVTKDIMEDAISMSLSQNNFPFLSGRVPSDSETPVIKSRGGRPYGEKNADNVPLLIIFILGGVTYSEIKCAYEVTEESKKWQVIIGSDFLLTPEYFLDMLRNSEKVLEGKTSD